MSTGPNLRFAALWWVLGWLMLAAVICGSLAPSRLVPDFHLQDKVVHFGAYFGMTFWFAGMTDRRRLPWVALALLALGGLIELAQGAVGTGRIPDWLDLAANAAGIAAAVLLLAAGLASWMERVERSCGVS